jgi:hypothetical protein
VEFKLQPASADVSDAAFLKLAAEYWQQQIDMLKPRETTVEVECEDGYVAT